LSQVPKFTKIQELVYELPVGRVMKKEVITVSPDTPISTLKEILRVNRISGVPVLDGDHLVGIISIEDLINALEQGDMQAPVRKRMSTQLITVREDESVIEAVNKFVQYRVGRLLVVNKRGGLTGILTGGNITRGLLEAVGKNPHAEKISGYRAPHIFQDFASDHTSLVLKYNVKARDFETAGSASSKVKRALGRLRVLPEVIRRVAISVYEGEMNLIIHSDQGGELIAELRPELIHITLKDQGPGIPDIERAMTPGFSTAPNWIRELGFGAGMGLANIKKCADSMKLESKVGVGTQLEIIIHLHSESGDETNTEKAKQPEPS
jgi:CBS domain-containing protein/anti-sigma regulatory factor (Ser/Thr protein kinase)